MSLEAQVIKRLIGVLQEIKALSDQVETDDEPVDSELNKELLIAISNITKKALANIGA